LIIEKISWEMVFYIFGSFGFFWYVFWLMIARKSPDYDKFISEEEKKHIMTSLELNERDNADIRIPWREIFTSMPVWAIIIAHFAENWGAYTMLTQLPTFFKSKQLVSLF
jgi:MFS transporter, ACS family, solute carrier family 17 (sodium-dependent inorganic phosphate cotransporter), other